MVIHKDVKRRGVKFRSLTEAIDTEIPTGRATWQMIGVLAELERSWRALRGSSVPRIGDRRPALYAKPDKLRRIFGFTAQQDPANLGDA